jgi:hypothetical protein
MSDVHPAPHRPDRHTATWLAVCCFLFFSIFTHGVFTGSDELGVFETTRAIFERGELSVPPGHHVFESSRDQRNYNHFAIGQSVLALPLYALGTAWEHLLPETWTRALAGPRIGQPPYVMGGTVQHFALTLYAPLVSALLVAVFFLFQRSLGASPRSALLASLLLAGCTYVGTMATYFLRHTTEALTLLAAFAFFFEYARHGRSSSLAWGSAIGASTLLIRVPALAGAPALIGYAGWAIARRYRSEGRSVLLPALRASLLPALAAVLVHVLVNNLKWGHWFESPMLAQHDHFTASFHIGLAGLLLSPGCSIFLYSPLLLLLPRTLPDFWARQRAECVAVLALSFSFLLVCSPFAYWHGLWSAPGPRYLFVLVPFLMLPLGPWLDAQPGRAEWIALLALALMGLVTQLSLMGSWFPEVVARMAYPPLTHETPDFLFSPGASPILGSAGTILASGRLNIWLWGLANGFPGRAGSPVVAFGLFALWLALLVACGRRLHRCVAG